MRGKPWEGVPRTSNICLM